MNKIVTIASSALALVLSGAALAGGVDHMAPAAAAVAPTSSSNFYVGLNGGYTMTSGDYDKEGTTTKMSEDFKNGFNGGAEVGYEMGPLRLAVSGQYYSLGKATGKDHDFTAYDGMGNVYYDLDMGQFQPYLGAGVGYININLKGANDTSSKGGLAYHGMAGIMYKINSNISIDLGYELMATTTEVAAKADATKKYKFSSAMFHSFNIGLHYDFV